MITLRNLEARIETLKKQGADIDEPIQFIVPNGDINNKHDTDVENIEVDMYNTPIVFLTKKVLVGKAPSGVAKY